MAKGKMTVKWYNNVSIVVALLIFLGYLGWILHASFESFFSSHKTFLQLLITDVSLYDVVFRCVVSGCFVILGIVFLNNVARRRYSEEHLKKANETLRLRNTVLELKVKERTGEV
jgi:hypothetical protein